MSPRENITALVLETNEDEEPCVECMKHTEALDRMNAHIERLTKALKDISKVATRERPDPDVRARAMLMAGDLGQIIGIADFHSECIKAL